MVGTCRNRRSSMLGAAALELTTVATQERIYIDSISSGNVVTNDIFCPQRSQMIEAPPALDLCPLPADIVALPVLHGIEVWVVNHCGNHAVRVMLRSGLHLAPCHVRDAFLSEGVLVKL
jgi:hypothetical protein